MSDHPEELLADYVEGALELAEREAVERHLAACDRCREEVELATEARAAAASLPHLEPPAGLPLAVRRRGRGIPSPVWGKVAAVAAGVIIAAGLVFTFTRLETGEVSGQAARGPEPQQQEEFGQPRPAAEPGAPEADSSAEDLTARASAGKSAPPSLPIYEETGQDYTRGGLAPLARGLRDEARAAIEAGIAPTAEAFFRRFDPARFTVPVRQAIRCVLTEVPPQQLIVPFRIEAASFQGDPAYVAAFLQGPTPTDPYDRVVLWVVDRETCSLQSLASQVL